MNLKTLSAVVTLFVVAAVIFGLRHSSHPKAHELNRVEAESGEVSANAVKVEVPRTGFFYVYDRHGSMVEPCAVLDENHVAQLSDCEKISVLSCKLGDNFISVFDNIDDCTEAMKSSAK